MLMRKAMHTMCEWKAKENRKSLVISGARQIGKTYIVRAFGKESYESFVELNFIENPEYNWMLIRCCSIYLYMYLLRSLYRGRH